MRRFKRQGECYVEAHVQTSLRSIGSSDFASDFCLLKSLGILKSLTEIILEVIDRIYPAIPMGNSIVRFYGSVLNAMPGIGSSLLGPWHN